MRLNSVVLGEALTQSGESLAPQPDALYKEITLRQSGVAVLRRTVEGSGLSGRRWVAHSGQFVVSRIDARNGSMAIVPPDLDGALVTNDFPLFDIDQEKLDPRYLAWLCRTPSFVRLCARASRGTTNRKRLKEAALLSLEVRVPPLLDQARVAEQMDRLQSSGAFVAERAAELVRLNEELLRTRFAALVAESPRESFERLAPVVRRPVVPVEGDLFPELGIRSFGRGTFHKPSLDYWSLGTKRLFRIEQGDLLLSNVFAWEGAIAIAGPRDHGRFGSHRFISCVPVPEVIDTRFLCYYLLTSEGLSQVGKASPGGAGRNRTLGLKRLAAIQVPVPPLEMQREFSESLTSLERLRVHADRMAALQAEATRAALCELIPSATGTE